MPDRTQEIATTGHAARMNRSALLLRVAAVFGLYCIVVLVLLLRLGRAPWDATSTVVVMLAALIGATALACVAAAQRLKSAERPSIGLLVGLSLFSLFSVGPLLALAFLWLAIVMQMTKPPAANQFFFWALNAGGVLFVLMQIFILAAAGMLRHVPIGKPKA